jgi:hypothetical protein
LGRQSDLKEYMRVNVFLQDIDRLDFSLYKDAGQCGTGALRPTSAPVPLALTALP